MKKKKVLLFFPMNTKGGIEKVVEYTMSGLNSSSDYECYPVSICSYDPFFSSETLGVEKNLKNIYLIRNSYYLYKKIKKHNPDIVVSFHGMAHITTLISMFLSRKKIYWVASEHGDPSRFIGSPKRIGGLLKNVLYKLALSHANKVYGVSQFVKNKIFKITNRKDISVINNPILIDFNADFHEPRVDLFRLVTCCRLIESKRVNIIIHAVKELQVRGYNVILDIIGDGDKHHYLQKLINDANLNDKINLLGAMEKPYNIYSKYDVFVSASNSEGMPISLMEASLSKLPIIMASFPGYSEFYEHSHTALVFPIDDVIELSNQIIYLMKDNNLRRILTLNAYDNIKEKTAFETYIKKMDDMLNDCT